MLSLRPPPALQLKPRCPPPVATNNWFLTLQYMNMNGSGEAKFYHAGPLCRGPNLLSWLF